MLSLVETWLFADSLYILNILNSILVGPNCQDILQTIFSQCNCDENFTPKHYFIVYKVAHLACRYRPRLVKCCFHRCLVAAMSPFK